MLTGPLGVEALKRSNDRPKLKRQPRQEIEPELPKKTTARARLAESRPEHVLQT